MTGWPSHDISPIPCPRCKRQPRLRSWFKYAGDTPATHYSLIIYKMECRRWFGLRLCFGPHKENCIDQDWSDLGRRVAIQYWNKAVGTDVRA